MKETSLRLEEFIVSLVFILGFVGYIMNFQNLFQYGVDTREFIVSAIGVFVPILGVFTGFLW